MTASATSPLKRPRTKDAEGPVVATPEKQARRSEEPKPARFGKADGVDVLVGTQTLFLPRKALEFIPKFATELAELGPCQPLRVKLGRCGLDIFEELLTYAMRKHLGHSDEEALNIDWKRSAPTADMSHEATCKQAREDFNKSMDLLVLGLQCGMGGSFKEKLIARVQETLPLNAKDFKKTAAVCKLLPACRELEGRPCEVLAETQQCWETGWNELFKIFLECHSLGLGSLVRSAASRCAAKGGKALEVLLAFLRRHAAELGQKDASLLVQHIGEMCLQDHLAYKLLKDEDKALFFQMADDVDLRKKVLDIQNGDGPYLKLPSISIFKCLQKAEVKMFSGRLVRWLASNPSETHAVSMELLELLCPEVRLEVMGSLYGAVAQSGTIAENLMNNLRAEERKMMIRCIARHLANLIKSSDGRMNESSGEKHKLLLCYACEFEEGDLRDVLKAINKLDLLPEKSTRRGVYHGVLVSLYLSNSSFETGERLSILTEIAMSNLDDVVRMNEYNFLWAGLQEAPILARPILEKLLHPDRPLTQAVEKAIKMDLEMLSCPAAVVAAAAAHVATS